MDNDALLEEFETQAREALNKNDEKAWEDVRFRFSGLVDGMDSFKEGVLFSNEKIVLILDSLQHDEDPDEEDSKALEKQVIERSWKVWMAAEYSCVMVSFGTRFFNYLKQHQTSEAHHNSFYEQIPTHLHVIITTFVVPLMRRVEVGHIFQLDTKAPEKYKRMLQNDDGKLSEMDAQMYRDLLATISSLDDVPSLIQRLIVPSESPEVSSNLDLDALLVLVPFAASFREMFSPFPLVLDPMFVSRGGFHAVSRVWNSKACEAEEVLVFASLVANYFTLKFGESHELLHASSCICQQNCIGEFIKAMSESMANVSQPELRELSFHTLGQFVSLLDDTLFVDSLKPLLQSSFLNVRPACAQLLKLAVTPSRPISPIINTLPIRPSRSLQALEPLLHLIFDVNSPSFQSRNDDIPETAWAGTFVLLLSTAANLWLYLALSKSSRLSRFTADAAGSLAEWEEELATFVKKRFLRPVNARVDLGLTTFHAVAERGMEMTEEARSDMAQLSMLKGVLQSVEEFGT
ncbi:hypothetical protein HDU97_003413 [Phlyctochytrium planicorne]|nr:hypothetical protein HDU97_003413 [Phlyctochytrium planicorne]